MRPSVRSSSVSTAVLPSVASAGYLREELDDGIAGNEHGGFGNAFTDEDIAVSGVAAKCSVASWVTSGRFISSGNGLKRLPERSSRFDMADRDAVMDMFFYWLVRIATGLGATAFTIALTASMSVG